MMNYLFRVSITSFLLFIFSNIIYAQTNSISSDSIPQWSLHGAVDVYYGYDLNKPKNQNRQYTTQAARHNEFNLNWGFIHGAYSGNNIRANIGLHTGTYVQFNYAAEPGTLTKMLYQANAGIRLGKNTWLDVGILPSHIGYENTYSGYNELYTRALMTENLPYYSTGAQLSTIFSEKLKASFVVLNGWQNIAETNEAKSVGIQVNYRPSNKLELNYSNYFGDEGNAEIGKKYRFFNDVYIKYHLTKSLYAVASFDYGTQELFDDTRIGNWYTGMFVLNYQINPLFSIAGRAELYKDKDQIIVSTEIPAGFQLYSETISFNYYPTSYAVLRAEARYYHSNDMIFNAGPEARKNNMLLTSSLAIRF